MLTENICLFSPNQTSDAQQLAVITIEQTKLDSKRTYRSVNSRGRVALKPLRLLITRLGGVAGLVPALAFLASKN
jgi:hypothetical protein